MKSNKHIYLTGLLLILGLFTTIGTSQRAHYIDELAFRSFIENRLNPLVAGYQYSVGDESGVLFGGSGGNRIQELGFTVPWHNGTRMMTASVSKMICTVAIMHMLENNAIANASTLEQKLDVKLKDEIPIRWRSLINGTEDDITLRMLLRHHSGFAGNGIESNPKTVLQNTMNTPLPDGFDYENINFNLAAFMVIYMIYPTDMAVNESNFSVFSDALYDSGFIAVIRTLYRDYVQNHIFTPIGITPDCAATLDSDDTEVFRYESKTDLSGYDLGNVSTCMSNGWILSANDMVRFMQKWANPQLEGNILSQESVDLINAYCASATSTPLGWVFNRNVYNNSICGYGHNGIWSTDNHIYTSEIVMIDDHTYMAINVNSNSFDSNATQRGRDLIDACNASYCVSNLNLNDVTMKSLNSAWQSITTTGLTIANSSDITVLKAGNHLTLKPGFAAEQGSSFRAYLDGCTSYPQIE